LIYGCHVNLNKNLTSIRIRAPKSFGV
jgi:hypothetical protein